MALIRIIVFQVRLYAFFYFISIYLITNLCECVLLLLFVRQFQNDSKQATIISVYTTYELYRWQRRSTAELLCVRRSAIICVHVQKRNEQPEKIARKKNIFLLCQILSIRNKKKWIQHWTWPIRIVQRHVRQLFFFSAAKRISWRGGSETFFPRSSSNNCKNILLAAINALSFVLL